jgi:hypothetical protein
MAPSLATLVKAESMCSRITLLPMKFKGVAHVSSVTPAARNSAPFSNQASPRFVCDPPPRHNEADILNCASGFGNRY